MSKFTINAVLAVLRVLIGVLSRGARLIYAILDLVDDGCLNASCNRPDWYQTFLAAASSLESLVSNVGCVKNELEK